MRGNARHIISDADGARHRRNMQNARRGFHFRVIHGRIGSAEINRFCRDVFDAAAGADRLVIDGNAGFGFIFLKPLLI